MRKTAFLLPAALLALALGACGGAKDDDEARPDSTAAATVNPPSGAPNGAPTAATAQPAAPVQGTPPMAAAPPPQPPHLGNAKGYADCLADAARAKSDDERKLLARTCEHLKP
ncbi:MAG: hypothetical protein JWM27_1922 [Gemmatimonadetes bacterium]|nr:hypothetical protein [Gemmatimonadota bacterium]